MQSEHLVVEDPGKKLGQARMLRKRALARVRQTRLRRMKLGKKSRAKMQRVMRGPEPAQVEIVVKVDPPFMPHDVMEPVPVPGKRARGRNNDLGVRESARVEVFGAIRDADLRRVQLQAMAKIMGIVGELSPES